MPLKEMSKFLTVQECNTILTVKHILLNCKKFENSRKNHLKNITSMTYVFDNNECKTILIFLHEVQLFEKIPIRKDRTWNPQVLGVASFKRAKTAITEKLYLKVVWKEPLTSWPDVKLPPQTSKPHSNDKTMQRESSLVGKY